MRFVDGRPCPSWMWCAIFTLFGIAVLPDTTLSFAQESSKQFDRYAGALPAGIGSATIEAVGQTNRYSTSSSHSAGRQLLYTVRVVELPTDEAKRFTETWQLAGGATATQQQANFGTLLESTVVPAAYTSASSRTSSTTSEVRLSSGLSEEQVDELVESGKVIHSPKIVGENGAAVDVRVGREVQFVAAFEPPKDQNGNNTATMQPVVGTIHHGITLELAGTIDDEKGLVRFELGLMHTELKGLGNKFTIESKDGPLTVQQPEVSSFGVRTSC